jgi:hypothetical protein
MACNQVNSGASFPICTLCGNRVSDAGVDGEQVRMYVCMYVCTVWYVYTYNAFILERLKWVEDLTCMYVCMYVCMYICYSFT